MRYEEIRKNLDASANRAAAAAEHVKKALRFIEEAQQGWQKINDDRPPEQEARITFDPATVADMGAAALQASNDTGALVAFYANSRFPLHGQAQTSYNAVPNYSPARPRTSTNATQTETPTGRPSLMPAYTPMDPAAEEARIDQWRNDQPVTSTHAPTAAISLSADDKALLEAYIQEHPEEISVVCGPGGTLVTSESGFTQGVPDPQVQAILQQTANAMLSHIEYDLTRSGMPIPSKTTLGVRITMGQFETDQNSIPHVDAQEALDDNTIRYVMTLLGPTTQFGDGTVRCSEFDMGGNAIPENPPSVVWSSSLPGQISRFRASTAHRGPSVDAPTARVFSSASYYIQGTRNTS